MSEKEKERLEIVSFKIPVTLLKQIDEVVKEKNYLSRSEFIRDAIRNELEHVKKGIKGRRK